MIITNAQFSSLFTFLDACQCLCVDREPWRRITMALKKPNLIVRFTQAIVWKRNDCICRRSIPIDESVKLLTHTTIICWEYKRRERTVLVFHDSNCTSSFSLVPLTGKWGPVFDRFERTDRKFYINKMPFAYVAKSLLR